MIRIYKENFLGHYNLEDPAVVWIALAAFSVPAAYFSWGRTIGCGFGFFLLLTVLGIIDNEHFLPFPVLSLGCILVGALLVWRNYGPGTAELFRARSRDKLEDYYLKHVLPAERELRQEVQDTWSPYLKPEEMLTLAPIRHE